MKLHEKAAMMIRTLMRDLHVQDHIVFPRDSNEAAFSSSTILAALDEDPMKTMLRTMLQGWCDHEKTVEARGQETQAPTQLEEIYEQAGCTPGEARLLVLFGHWGNDVISEAAHYGLTVARRQPDGTLLHNDGTVDTLLKGGKLEVVDIPPAPSREHYWHKGRWNAPEPDQSGADLG